jgi:hypothetical protein
MQEVTSDRLQIAYIGPALERGQMSMLALGSSLRGQALLIERVKDVLYQDRISLRVEVDHEFEQGSLLVPVHIFVDVLSGPNATAIANLLQILGFAGWAGTSLYKLFKKLKGRRIEKPEDVPKELDLDIPIQLLVKLYNDPEVQAQLRRALDPLHQVGIEEIQTRRQRKTIESVSKKDLLAADDAEIEDLTKDEEIDLDIEKCAWRQDLAQLPQFERKVLFFQRRWGEVSTTSARIPVWPAVSGRAVARAQVGAGWVGRCSVYEA